MKLQFSRQNFATYSNIKFHYYSSIRSRVTACGRTDKHTWRS